MDAVIRAREKLHPDCFACSANHPAGPGLQCEGRSDGTVVGRVVLDGRFQGYPGIAQGGVVATLLDSAMAQCLMALGIAAVTADLRVRFRSPVELGVPTEVQARVMEAAPPLFRLQADVRQGLRVVATGRGVFVDRREEDAGVLDTEPGVGENAGDSDPDSPGA